jgi:hypothetical protein
VMGVGRILREDQERDEQEEGRSHCVFHDNAWTAAVSKGKRTDPAGSRALPRIGTVN